MRPTTIMVWLLAGAMWLGSAGPTRAGAEVIEPWLNFNLS